MGLPQFDPRGIFKGCAPVDLLGGLQNITPQAVAWERLHLERVVARYAVKLTAAEQPDSSSAQQAEVRQMEDRLGLSAMAMLRLRWEITDDAPAAPSGGDVPHLDDYRTAI